ncbi:MAG TPA: ABC transporter ATP-binding protein [Ferrovibrio sp.]|uniref:ABC transporter ATP-binding protein n=1 Tax=Ferrovibrio sp. TaxID=1917215 RepID=UPI002B4B06D3|nr:ABC transporter ATP-binding protein [Ferrovibrio sp.]HLT78093.1 ABC transporter ATP-binding protein [Ferrovibrio sp.]
MTAPVLSIRNLSVALPAGGDRALAVKNVSFDVMPGEIVCLVGESGSGKSVTASTVMRLSPLTVAGGSIELEGEDVLKAGKTRLRQLRGGRMSMIFQEPMTALNPVHRVGEQVAELLRAHRWQGKGVSVEERVAQLFADVKLPDPERLLRSYPHQLSGGQRQRVMIAMALALEPALLIADEPTTALDVTTQAQILELLRELQRKRGTGVLFITHDFGVVADIADRVVVMRHGEVVESGRAADVLHNPQHDYTKMLIAAVPRLNPREARPLSGTPSLSARDLQKLYVTRGLFRGTREVRAVDHVDLDLYKGQTLGIVGESGSGKSTAARCIARLIAPSGGSIMLDGQDIANLNERGLHPFRRRIQVVFQDPYRSLNPRRTVGQSIIEGPLNYGISRDEALQRARQLMETVGIDAAALDRYPHQFSGGQRQRIAIARALAMEPEILVADEAVSALDVSVQAQVLDLLESIRDSFGISILFITHDLRVAARLCDRIAVMQHGRIVEFADTATLFAAPQHDYTKQLFAALPGRSWLEGRTAP